MAIQDARTLKFLKYLEGIGSPLAVQVRKYINNADNNSVYALPEWTNWVTTAYPPKPVSDIDPFTGQKTQVAKTREANASVNQTTNQPNQPWVATGVGAVPQPPSVQGTPTRGPVAFTPNPQGPWTVTGVGAVPQPPVATSYTVVYGGTVWQGNDGKYYDPATGFPLSDDELKYRYQKFLQGEVNPLNNPQDPNAPKALSAYELFLIEQAKLDRQRQDYKDQVEQERQQAEARNKAWVFQNESQRMASETAIEKQRNEMELIKGRSFPFGDEVGRRMQGARDMSGAFESARQSILASLSSPSDWIKRWEVQNAANPYIVQPQPPLESASAQVSDTETRVNMFNQMADEAQKLVDTLSADPNYGAGPNGNGEATVLTQARADVANYRAAAAAEGAKIPAFKADVTYLQGQPQPSPSGNRVGGGSPTAPGWLPMFAPGQRAGQAITRQDIPTPSAQQWTATPWSVQQGVAGYTDWAGYRPMADILGNMAQMLPNSPGGGSRWSPYIGR